MPDPMDPVASFGHLVEHVPRWQEQLSTLTAHAAAKNAEFAAEYARVVSRIRPKRIKSPSMQSIHSSKDRSIRLSQIDPLDEATLPTPPKPIDIDPLEAGNKYLYAQAQRKRKPGSSIRSGASGPQKFRSKKQVIVYYDSELQNTLESMVKALSVARNNLRLGRNALNASRGFQLPTLTRRFDANTLTPSMENMRAHSGNLSVKYSLRSSSQAPSSGDEACFTDVDHMLEHVQGLYETAAHQFLRDGDCKSELESARSQLNSIFDKSQSAHRLFVDRAKKDEGAKASNDGGRKDSETTLTSQTSFDSLSVAKGLESNQLAQTLKDMSNRPLVDAPTPPTNGITPATASMSIEVDDDVSDDGSLADLDISQFRMNTRLLRG
jgi:hypothetical protein